MKDIVYLSIILTMACIMTTEFYSFSRHYDGLLKELENIRKVCPDLGDLR